MCGTLQEASFLRRIDKCRSCGSSSLKTILDLGNPYIVDFVKEKKAERGRAPLELVHCQNCSLLQLRHTVNPERLFRQYFYRSSVNPKMVEALKDIAVEAQKLVKLNSGDVVLDIGANDGTLLSFLPDYVTKIGYEPAKNLMSDLSKHADIIINDFFSHNDHTINYKAKLIFSVAMFYDLDDPNTFVSDVAKCLDEDGVFVIEQRYLPSMLMQLDIGNVVHEHLCYYSLSSLKPLLERHGLEVFYMERTEVNGGSFRVYAKHKGSDTYRKIVHNYLAYEQSFFSGEPYDPYEYFVWEIEENKRKTLDFLKEQHSRGKVVHVLGASTKGNYVLQYFGLDYKMIEAASDRDPNKHGKYMVGTWIPIISEEESRRRADYYLVLIWFYKQGLINREKEFLERGGHLIFPFPGFEVM